MKRCISVFLVTALLMCLLPFNVVSATELTTVTAYGTTPSYFTSEEAQKTPSFKRLEEIFAAKGIKLDVTMVDSDQYTNVLQALILSDDLPDFFNASSLTSTDCVNLIEAGKILSIDDCLPYSDGTAATAFAEGGTHYVLRQKDTYTDGKLYFTGNISVLPSAIDPVFGYSGVTGGTYGMKIRKDWLDKLGLAMPTTLDEYLDVLVAFREKDANGNGIADERMVLQLNTCNSTFGGFFDTGVSNWFGLANYMFQLNRKTWKVELPYFQDGFVDYVNFIKKCVEANVLYLSDNVEKSDTALSALIAQNVVSSYQYMSVSDVYTDENQDYVYIPAIQAVEGIDPVATGSVGYKGYGYFGLSSKVDPKVGAAFLDAICSQDYAVWHTYGGQEGVTYQVVDGSYQSLMSTKKEELQASGLVKGSYLGAFVPGLTTYAIYSTYKGESQIYESYDAFLNSKYFKEVVAPTYTGNKYQSFMDWCEKAKTLLMYDMNSDLTIILPLMSAEDAEVISTYQNDLYTYMDELFANLISGNQSLEDIDTYRQDMIDMGLYEMRDIYQKLFDQVSH